MLKVAHVVGARPQFMKYFPIYRATEKHNTAGKTPIETILIHTGQHYDYNMSKVFFDEFGMPVPHHHLEVGSGNHGRQTGQVLEKCEEVFLQEKPQVVVIYGDTNSTLGAALAAAKIHIPVVHVEAGLRSYNRFMPEELNRIVADSVSTVLYCPSRIGIENLQKEGYQSIANQGDLLPKENLCEILKDYQVDKNNPLVANVGDVMYDVVLYASELAQEKSTILQTLSLEAKKYIMLTLHRAENTDDPARLEKMIQFINRVSSDTTVIFPRHPRTKKAFASVKESLGDHVQIVDPLGYFDNIKLLQNASHLLTDSGGMQKEAFWLKVPCLTLRDETEWKETVESGWNTLYLDYQNLPTPPDTHEQHYGDGQTSERLVETLVAFFGA